MLRLTRPRADTAGRDPATTVRDGYRTGMTSGSQEPHQKDLDRPENADAGDDRLRDMGGDTGPTQPSTRGGSGLGPEEVRAADEHARESE